MDNLVLIGIVALVAFFVGRASQGPKLARAEAETKEARAETQQTQRKLNEVQALFEHTLLGVREDSVLLPGLVRWADRIQEMYDEAVAVNLRTKKHPARKAAIEVRTARSERRQAVREREIALNRIDFYERLAPWLSEYTELSVAELFAGMREEEEAKAAAERGEDPVSRHVPLAEWNKLSPSERNQMALDRYCDPRRRQTPWSAGIQYERFVGYEFEQRGYKVKYQGAVSGKSDFGLDLMCENEGHVLAIQCKRFHLKMKHLFERM